MTRYGNYNNSPRTAVLIIPKFQEMFKLEDDEVKLEETLKKLAIEG